MAAQAERKRTTKLNVICAIMPLFGSIAAPGAAHDWHSVPLNEQTFDVSKAETARFEQIGERAALCINGEAFARDISIESGSIAVDIANHDRRSFANLIFRASSHDVYETVYLRMHKSGQFDAVQYTPHLFGETNWQLFREAQARVDFGDEAWITLQVDFDGDQARVSVGDTGNEPALTTHLTLPAQEGMIGLRTLFEGCFANFRYSETAPSFPEGSGGHNSPFQAGVIDHWSLSNAFPLEGWAGLAATLPADPVWSSARTERNGRLLISRYRRKQSSGGFEGNQLDGVYAGAAIHSDTDQVAALQIDASDMATVWLNGSVLYAFDNSFRAKGPLFRGDFDASRQTVSLQLKEGRNELIVLVAERANGWGLAASVTAQEPVRVEPIESEQ